MQSFIVHPKSYAKVQDIFLKSKRFSRLNFIVMHIKLKAMLYQNLFTIKEEERIKKKHSSGKSQKI